MKSKWASAAMCVILSVAAAAGASAAASAVVAGVVITLKGKPQLRKAGKKAFEPLKFNAFVYEGDFLKTGTGDGASVAFIGGAEVRLAETSTFLIESGGGQMPTQLRTKWGKAWTRLLHGRAGLNIHTPAAVCSVRGTEADVEAQDQLTVKVYEGVVDVSNGQGIQVLTAGQMTQVADAGTAPQAPQQMGSQDKENWQDGLKSEGAEPQIEKLREEAERRRDVELKLNKGGQEKKIKLQLKKKKQQ